MVKFFGKRLLPFMLAMLLVMTAMPLGVFASTTVSVLDGQVSITDDVGTGTVSDRVVTITATGTTIYRKQNNITFTNESSNKATLSFDYTISGYDEHDFPADSGTYSVILDAGATVTRYIIAPRFKKTVTLEMSNFSLIPVADSSDITFEYDSTLGSVTAGGVAVDSGYVAEDVTLESGIAVSATPVSGAAFLGWVNTADGAILSSDTSYTINPTQDTTVQAVFTKTDGTNIPWYYLVDNNCEYLYGDFDIAMTYASNSTDKTVVLVNDSTLPAGDYTIPSGVTLLVPFDEANTLYTDTPGFYETANSFSVTPTKYRTLKIASGANINVNGAISVSAQTNASGGGKLGAGSPVGPCGFIDMATDSNIIINSGANLYAWGYITGSGNIMAKSGSDVYENFQMQDFRGGDQISQLSENQVGYKVFPMSQYYVQNIEVPLTIEAGASEHSFTAIDVTLIGKQGTSIEFISNENAMFNLKSGSVTKYYDGSTDRLMIEADGNLEITPISMTIRASAIASTTIDSSKYFLPINNNITVKVNSGNMEINQDIALLPGAEIIVGENATCTFGEGTTAVVYDADDWGTYCGVTNKTFISVQYAPGKKYTRTDADLKDGLVQIDGVIDASNGYVYTTGNGANVCSTGTGIANVQAGTDTITYQMIQASDPEYSTFVEIPITPAKLKNADETYLESVTGTYVYSADHEKWAPESHTFDSGVTVAPTCEENGYTRYTCTCGYYYDDAIVEATGHDYNMDIVEPTCTTEGKKHEECKICNDVRVDEVLPIVDHVTNEVTTAPTRTEAGSVVVSCENCDFEEITVLEATGHSYESVVTAPTCTEQGYTTHTCTVCDDIKVDTYVDALGHSYGNWTVLTEADCENEGVEYRVCSRCNNEETRVIDANGHNYDAVVTEPTCTEQGYTTYTCNACSNSYVDDYVKANGHSHEAVVTEPTCTEQGYTTYTCTVCSDCYVDNYVAPAGHDMGDWIIDTAASCETDGAKHKECSACDYTEEEIISATGHAYSSVVTEPTCTEQGYTTHTCANCSDSYVDSYISANGHTYGEWTTVKAPTHTESGLKKHICHCGDEETEIISMIICDYDGDGKVDTIELSMMRKFILETVVPTAEETTLFDMNDDGKISIKDLVRLKKYTAGIDY